MNPTVREAHLQSRERATARPPAGIHGSRDQRRQHVVRLGRGEVRTHSSAAAVGRS